MSERVLPEGWVETTLGQVVEYGKAEKATREQVDDDTWVLELEDIEKSSSRIIQRLSFSERKFMMWAPSSSMRATLTLSGMAATGDGPSRAISGLNHQWRTISLMS